MPGLVAVLKHNDDDSMLDNPDVSLSSAPADSCMYKF